MRRKNSVLILLAVYVSLTAGEGLYSAEEPKADQKPFVVLNGRKLTKGENFSFLTDCGFYRFTVKSVAPDYGSIELEYPAAISGPSPFDAPPYRKKKESYESAIFVGTTCFLIRDCSEKNNQVCFTLQKKKMGLGLSYEIKVPPRGAVKDAPMQKVDTFFKSGLNKDKKESEKTVPAEKKTAPSNWFVY